MPSLDEIFKKIYEPKNKIPDQDLPRAIRERKVQSRKEAEESVKLKELPPSGKGGDRPLTIKEAEVVEERIEQLRARAERIKGKISEAETQIIQQLEGNPDLPSFAMNIVGKPRLRHAAKGVYGHKAEEVTFPMYRQALQEKQALEKADSESMFAEDDEASSNSNIMDLIKGAM